jgi:hypothetical protein
MGDVIQMPIRTPESVLQLAIKESLVNVIVIGETQDGSTHISMSSNDIPLAVFLLAVAKKALLDESLTGDE